MRHVDVVWLVEHVARELDVACAVRAHIHKRYGLSMKIFHMWRDDLFVLAQRYLPKVVVIPYAYGVRRGFMRKYLPKWREAVFFNMAWEQLHENAYKKLKRPEDRFVRDHVIHLAWGEFYRDYLLDSGVPEQHIFFNGHPSLVLYKAPYRYVIHSREFLSKEFGLDPDRRWIFFPESYSWAFRDEKWVRTQVNWGVPPETVKICQEFCKRSLSIVLHWLAQVALHEGVEIIFRPRPTTSREDYMELIIGSLSEIPTNIHFIKEYSIKEWILASNIVMSSHSTSLIEAAIAGRSTFMVLPHPLPYPMHSEWMGYCRQVNEAQEFYRVCSGENIRTTPDPLSVWAKSELVHVEDPISQLADYLYYLCQADATRPPTISDEELRKLLPDGYSMLHAYEALSLTGKLTKRFRNYWNHIEKYWRRRNSKVPEVMREHFTQHEVNRKTRSFLRVLESCEQ